MTIDREHVFPPATLISNLLARTKMYHRESDTLNHELQVRIWADEQAALLKIVHTLEARISALELATNASSHKAKQTKK